MFVSGHDCQQIPCALTSPMLEVLEIMEESFARTELAALLPCFGLHKNVSKNIYV